MQIYEIIPKNCTKNEISTVKTALFQNLSNDKLHKMQREVYSRLFLHCLFFESNIISSSQGIVLFWAPLKSDSKESGFFYFIDN